MPLCCNCARYTSKDVGGELAEVVEGIATVVGGRMIGGRVVGGRMAEGRMVGGRGRLV